MVEGGELLGDDLLEFERVMEDLADTINGGKDELVNVSINEKGGLGTEDVFHDIPDLLSSLLTNVKQVADLVDMKCGVMENSLEEELDKVSFTA